MNTRARAFQKAIEGFLADSKEAKLKGKKSVDQIDKIEARFGYHTWLASAVERASQLHIVTHPLKATHPAAKGSSLTVAPDSLPQRPEVGSHCLGQTWAEDVVGNAAALDVYRFLKVEVEGRRLLEWMLRGDAGLAAALHPEADTAREWMAALAGVAENPGEPTTHQMAKQVYWLVEGDADKDDNFHLLQPMFASSLAQAVHEEIQDARFGEANKAARKARRDKKPHDEPCRAYPDLVQRQLGGANQQNVSQLNSERAGINYLLSCRPPQWQTELRKPLGTESVIERLARDCQVRANTRDLVEFLRSDPPKNDRTRRRRRELEQALGARLAEIASHYRQAFGPGWTRDADCTLRLEEKLWLDPERVDLPLRTDPEQADEDLSFRQAMTWGDWPDEIAGHFARFINERLRKAGLPVGDAEYEHFARQAIVEANWPIPMGRRAPGGAQA